MSRLVLSSDLHLGHRGIIKYRKDFLSPEDHHEAVLQAHKDTIKKTDTWVCLGDVAFDYGWLMRLDEIKCKRKILILGNHDTERLHVSQLLHVFDEVKSLESRSFNGTRYWLSHCPIHPQEFRGKSLNIHGHLHGDTVWVDQEYQEEDGFSEVDQRYINVCVEHTDLGVVPVEDLL